MGVENSEHEWVEIENLFFSFLIHIHHGLVDIALMHRWIMRAEGQCKIYYSMHSKLLERQKNPSHMTTHTIEHTRSQHFLFVCVVHVTSIVSLFLNNYFLLFSFPIPPFLLLLSFIIWQILNDAGSLARAREVGGDASTVRRLLTTVSSSFFIL